MRTRLPPFLDRLVEGGWLAALVVTPLFFNLLTARTFEPDKAALLRAIVLVMLAAWAGWLLVRPRSGVRPHLDWRSPTGWLLGSGLLLVAVLFISALTGLNPRISLLGSYNRDQGVVTLLAYLAVCLLIAVRLRAADQLRRLLDTVVLVGLAVGVYGVLQRFGVDPVPWGGFGDATTLRVIGTQGNATFLADYLVLAMLVTLFNLLAARRAGRTGALAAYGVALAFQFLALLFSDSRGATLGLAVGLAVWALAHAAWRGKRRLAVAVAGLAVVGMLSLVLLNVAGGAVGNVPIVGRLSRLTDTTTGSNAVRALMWEGMSDLIQDEGGRLALGVGPEALYLRYYPYFQPALRTVENPLTGTHDRSHNEVLDRLATTGVVGLGAWLALVGGLLYAACAWLGLTSTTRQRWSLIGALIVGAALGGLTPFLMSGSLRFAGLGLGLGLIVGLGVWLLWRGLRQSDPSIEDDATRAVIPMLLGALVTHLVEIQVGIPVTATQTLFWTLAGALVAVGVTGLKVAAAGPVVAAATPAATVSEKGNKRGRATRSARPAASDATRGASGPDASLLLGLVGGLAIATLTYGLIERGISLAPAFVVLLLLTAAILVVGAALVASAGMFLTTAVITGVVYLILHLPIALTTATAGPAAFSLFVALLLAWLAVFAWLATRDMAAEPTSATSGALATVGALGLVAAAGIWFLSLQPIYADSYVRLGQLYGQIGRWDQAVAAYEEALRITPAQDFVRPNVAQAYLAQAQTATDAATRQAAFDKARGVLQEASRLSPHNPEYLLNLGAAEQYWAEKGPAETRLRMQSDAEAHYRAAAALAPFDPHVLRRWGRLKLEQGAPAEAIPMLEQAIALLLPEGVPTNQELARSITAEIRTDLARAYAATGRTADAVAQLRIALSLAPPNAQAPIQDLLKQLGASGS